MKLLIVRGHTVHHWRCAHCGRTSDSSVKPGMGNKYYVSETTLRAFLNPNTPIQIKEEN